VVAVEDVEAGNRFVSSDLVALELPPMGAYGWTIQHLVECGALGALVALIWPAQEWWLMLELVEEERLVLGAAHDIAILGALGRFELGKNRDWVWVAF
jgi:hypothetical protein